MDVFGDFLRYLFRFTRSFIIDTHANGKTLWQALHRVRPQSPQRLGGRTTDTHSLDPRHGFLVADAGGGTLDISSYAMPGTNPLVIEEVALFVCFSEASSIFLNQA
jgi:hypothetical protein